MTTRRLAAILAADVVGFSKLIGEDEAGTLAALREIRKGIVNPILAEHGGRVFKLMGDGMLAEFPSAVQALDAAMGMQERLRARNADATSGKRIEVRIGIHQGDVVVEGGDLLGDGVNIAARLEALAEPGGVCISGRVYEDAGGKIVLDAKDMGEQSLKNIARSVRAYRVSVVAAGAGSAKTNGDRPALALPDKPSIAVLPFQNMSGDPEQEYFSDGITEDIITELSRFRTLFVIARNSSFAFRNKSTKVQEIARELGVAYVVEGSVRRAADRVRITAQLVDAGSGNHLWAERYDREMRDIFAVQDEVARAVASTVSGRVEAAGRDRVARLSPAALRAYDLVLRAKALTAKYTKDDNAQAIACAERAVELDPTNARAHTHLAWCHFFNRMAGWTADRDKALAKAYELAQRAVVLDETDSFGHCILGLIHLFRREFDEARLETEKAIDLNPNDPEARRYYGDLLAATGRPDAAIEQIDLGKRLNPFDTHWVPWIRGIACFTAHRYGEAIVALRQARDPINEVRGWLAASYAHAGRLEEASATLEEFLRVAESDMATFPGRRLKDWVSYWHGAFEYRDQKDFDHLFDALRKAGLPE